MIEYEGRERRENYRKKYNIPIKLIPRKRISLNGNILNINCYGLKVELSFKSTAPGLMLDAIFAAPRITLEFANMGDKINVALPANNKWKSARCDNGEMIYDVGFALNLNEKQQQDWRKLYDLLDS